MASTMARIMARTDICGGLCDGWLMNAPLRETKNGG